MKRVFLFLLLITICFGSTGGPDDFGHIFADNEEIEVEYLWFPTDSATVVSGWIGTPGEDSSTRIWTSFPIVFYGNNYDSFMVSTNGFITFNFTGTTADLNLELPVSYDPDNMIAAYWDDLAFSDDTRVYFQTVDTAPNRKFIVTWENIFVKDEHDEYDEYISPNSFQIVFYENPGETPIKIQYREIGSLVDGYGTSATVGIENFDGSDGLTYSYNDSLIFSEMAVMFTTGFYDYDIAMMSELLPDTILTGTEVTPQIVFGNSGLEMAEDIILNLDIYDPGLTLVYSDSVSVDSLASAYTDTLAFAHWYPSIYDLPGEYSVTAVSNMSSDENASNDSIYSNFYVLAHDLAIQEILIPSLVFPGSFVDLRVVVKNRGGERASGYLLGQIFADSSEILYDSVEISISSDQVDTISLTSWVPDSGNYELEFYTRLVGDQISSNDTMTHEVSSFPHYGNGGPDDFGYEWYDSWFDPSFAFTPIDITGATLQSSLTGYENTTNVSLPFEFPFYGENQSTVYISSNGFISFNALIYGSHTRNQNIPSVDMPDGVIAPLWDAIYISSPMGINGVYTKAEDGAFHIIFYNVAFFSSPAYPLTFEIILFEDGDIVFNYETVEVDDAFHSMGKSATIGIENPDGTIGLEYLYNGSPAGNQIMDNTAITFTVSGPPPDTIPPVIIPIAWEDSVNLFGDDESIELTARIYDVRSTVVSESLYYNFNGIENAIGYDDFDDPDVYTFLVDGLDTTGLLSGYFYARDSEGFSSTESISVFIEHPYEDFEPPAIFASVFDTMWLIPGSGGYTYLSAEMSDTFGLIDYDSLFVHHDMMVNSFGNDSITAGGIYHYTIGPFEPGDSIGIQFVAEDTAGNLAEYPPSGHLDFVAWEQHGFGPVLGDNSEYWLFDNYYESDDDSIFSLIPDYEWIEIHPDSGGRGEIIVDAATNWISDPIEFSSLHFPFYDETEPRRNSIRVSSRGFVTFDNAFGPPIPEPGDLPSEEYPGLLIAPLHSDFVMDSLSSIVILEDIIEQRLIVQWNNLSYTSWDTITYATFQIVMRCSEPIIGGFFNNIAFNYKDVNMKYYDESTIGFQDNGKSNGMRYPTNQRPYIASMPQPESSIRVFNTIYNSIADRPNILPGKFAILNAYPNPFNSSCRINFSSKINGNIDFEIFSLDGRLIHSEKIDAILGRNAIDWKPDNCETGLYLARFSDGEDDAFIRLLYVK